MSAEMTPLASENDVVDTSCGAIEPSGGDGDGGGRGVTIQEPAAANGGGAKPTPPLTGRHDGARGVEPLHRERT